ncbi:DNA photolyase [Candidatus Desulfarcum epimagneticum]|uniref:DNA photolyase n=1 Tax=uncultured Desulfobacteraceae bacterium TaxID=218296 RepID=A0A484HDM1_9BACT|nr:DNA photolyase [uncultured Desulfobacteraceae bacterium]
MTRAGKITISASRRTDIPAFYMEWLMDRIVNRGFFETVNPYSRKTSVVPAGPDQVGAIVFWSKNFGPFLKEKRGETLLKKGFHLYFHFTLNSKDRLLEPRVPPLEDRLEQMKALSERFGAQNVNWRFDPVCFYRTSGKSRHNLADFPVIAETAARGGVASCVTSFMDHYPKISRRIPAQSGFGFFDPPLSRKIETALRMENLLAPMGIALSLCCEKAVLEGLPAESNIQKSACVPNDFFIREFGGPLSTSRDRGQRPGCGCMVSVDVGVYHLHPCPHDCLFCYANPQSARLPETPGKNPGRKNGGRFQ